MGKGPITEGSLAKKQQPQVIVIEADKELRPKKLRVAAYARVSSDSADQLNSFMAQVRYYTTYITSREEWTFVDLYADEGITGTSAGKRAEFQRLIADCKRGLIDKVLCKSISRFARNTVDSLTTNRRLKEKGVGETFEYGVGETEKEWVPGGENNDVRVVLVLAEHLVQRDGDVDPEVGLRQVVTHDLVVPFPPGKNVMGGDGRPGLFR